MYTFAQDHKTQSGDWSPILVLWSWALSTKLYSVIRGYEDEIRLQDNISDAYQQANKWQIALNIKKCKTMHLGNKASTEYYLKEDGNKMRKIKQITDEKLKRMTYG
jgi:hypothetical protein